MASMAKVIHGMVFFRPAQARFPLRMLDHGRRSTVFPWYFAISMVFSKVLPYLLPYPRSLDITGFLTTGYGEYGKYGKKSLSLLSVIKIKNNNNKRELKYFAILAIPAILAVIAPVVKQESAAKDKDRRGRRRTSGQERDQRAGEGPAAKEMLIQIIEAQNSKLTATKALLVFRGAYFIAPRLYSREEERFYETVDSHE